MHNVAYYNLILDKLRKHLINYNFCEQQPPLTTHIQQLVTTPQRLFCVSPLFTPPQPNIVELALTTTSPLDHAWLIKIIDTFLSESLLFEAYSLKINSAHLPKEHETLTETLRILSVSFIESKELQTFFEFSARNNQTRHILCASTPTATTRSNDKVLAAQIHLDALLDCNHKLTLPSAPTLHVVIPLNQAQNTLALLLATMLHTHGRCVDVLLNNATTQLNLDLANTMHAKFLLLLGEDEQKNGDVTLKNIHNGTVETIKQTHIFEYI